MLLASLPAVFEPRCAGSAYYQTYENFFAFAANGLKSDFNGHDNRHFRNVYGYVDNCWYYARAPD